MHSNKWNVSGLVVKIQADKTLERNLVTVNVGYDSEKPSRKLNLVTISIAELKNKDLFELDAFFNIRGKYVEGEMVASHARLIYILDDNFQISPALLPRFKGLKK